MYGSYKDSKGSQSLCLTNIVFVCMGGLCEWTYECLCMTDECIVRMGGWIRLTSKVKLARTQNQGDGWMGGWVG